jgi:hypothetical protein
MDVANNSVEPKFILKRNIKVIRVDNYLFISDDDQLITYH